jgi:hypothetical protein
MTLEDAPLELPRYKCHKEVRALKIKGILPGDWQGAATVPGHSLVFEDTRYPPRFMSENWAGFRTVKEGGYLIVYADGYESYSTAKAFEDGYTLIP